MSSIEIDHKEKWLLQCLKCKRIYLIDIDDWDNMKCCDEQLHEIGEIVTEVY